MGAGVDWLKIKTEYITTATSYRKLADKHGVPFRTLADRAKSEGWSAARKKHCNDVVTKALRKSANQQADKMARFTTVSDKLLNRIERIIEESEEGNITAKDIRSLTAAVKDLKEIQGVRSELDRQEQEARIANLRRQAQNEEKTSGAKLEIVGLPEEFMV